MDDQPHEPIPNGCQLFSYSDNGAEPWAWFLRRKARGALRRLRRLWTAFAAKRGLHQASIGPDIPTTTALTELAAGDAVRVRPLEEIARTLDAQGRCHGCAFLSPMAQYCGRELRVAKRVDRFFDEARWRMLKCRGVVLIDGAYCDGSGHPDTRGCDRMCFFFWRTEWLEKVGQSLNSPSYE